MKVIRSEKWLNKSDNKNVDQNITKEYNEIRRKRKKSKAKYSRIADQQKERFLSGIHSFSQKKTCPYCLEEVIGTNFTKFHGNNCKMNPDQKNSVRLFFESEDCQYEVRSDGKVTREMVYNEYVRWCSNNGVENKVTKNNFKKYLPAGIKSGTAWNPEKGEHAGFYLGLAMKIAKDSRVSDAMKRVITIHERVKVP